VEEGIHFKECGAFILTREYSSSRVKRKQTNNMSEQAKNNEHGKTRVVSLS
jgi:hypothetical protein